MAKIRRKRKEKMITILAIMAITIFTYHCAFTEGRRFQKNRNKKRKNK
jgi:hypothetical protein